MLQIIGLIGCFYLFLKGFELWGTPNSNRVLRVGAIISLVGSVVFAGLVMRTFAADEASAYSKCVLGGVSGALGC